jgi:hypothetical protein
VVAPTVTTAVVSTATPVALASWRAGELASWRATLNMVGARPVACGEIVANAAAWDGTNTWPMATPRQNISTYALRPSVGRPPMFEDKGVTFVGNATTIIRYGGTMPPRSPML